VRSFRLVQLWATIATLTLAPLFFGSVDLIWVALWTIVLSIGCLCGLARQTNVWQRRALYTFTGICIAYAVLAAIQIAPNLIAGLDDPIWQRASKLLEINLPSRVSGRAEIPPVAIGHFLLVVTSFVNGFLVGTSRRDSGVLSVVAKYSILLYAIYGLFAWAFTPDLLLWAPKTAYVGSLTSTFVNHNTAATFVGVGAILWSCSAVTTLRSLEFSSLRVLLLIPSNERVAFKLILRSTAGLLCFFALLLTGSRGGLVCFCLGLFAAFGLLIAGRARVWSWYLLGFLCLALVATFSWLTQFGRIASLGLFDQNRWYVYEYCIEAIRQRPLLGAGLGTFADLFPSLRGPDLSRWGVWDYAHSTVLEIAVEMGLPIAAMLVIAAGASFFILLRAALRSTDRSRSSFAAIAGVAVLVFLHSIIDFSLQMPGFLVVFWILIGCALARALDDARSIRRSDVRNAAKVPRKPDAAFDAGVASV
jgi:O-antigen ligase